MRLLPILLAVAVPVLALAQDDEDANTVHASTVIHDDGTRTVTVTDPEKHTSEADTYDAGNRLMQKVVYTLDDQNQPASGVIYSGKGQPMFKSTYKRDDMNRISEEDDYTMDDQLLRRFVYEFGPDGKVARIRAYDAQGNEMQQTEAHKDRRQSPPFIHQ